VSARHKTGQSLDALSAFAKWLESLAYAASAPDEPLSEKLINKEREFLRRHGEIFSGAVDDLLKIIAYQPYEHAREHGFYQLWAALGSAVVIGRHTTIDFVKERLDKDKMIPVRAAKPKPAKDIDRLIAERFKLAREKKQHLSDNAIARIVASDLNRKLKKPLTSDAIRKRYERMTAVPK
jgi:hypothetical protein